MPNTNEVYGQVAAEGAKLIWQTAGSALTQVGVLLTAGMAGSVMGWLMGNRTPASQEKPSLATRVNPLKWNPLSLGSFVLTPFKSVRNLISWSAAEVLADEFKDTINKPWQKLAPIGEKFLTPLVEKAITPFLDFLQNKGLMQIPQPVVETICEVCPDLRERATESLKQAAIPESTGLFNNLWARLNHPFFNLGSKATEIIHNLPSKMEQVFSTPEVVKPVTKVIKPAMEVIKPAIKPVLEHAREATHIPKNYFELTEKYAEPAGRRVAETLSTAFSYANKAIHSPNHIVHAVNDAADVLAEALGVDRYWIIGAGAVTVGLASYGIYSGMQGIYNRNTAVATATGGNAMGGKATGNTLNVQITLPTQTPGQTTPTPVDASAKKLTQ